MIPSPQPRLPRSHGPVTTDRHPNHYPDHYPDPPQGADVALLRSLRQSIRLPWPKPWADVSDIEGWRQEVADLVERHGCATIGLKAARSHRKLGFQIQIVSHEDLSDPREARSDSVLRYDRLLAQVEAECRQRQERCSLRQASLRRQLSPQVLLRQARLEWAAVEADPALADDERFQSGQAIVLALIDLTRMLHPDVMLPGLRNWIGDRVADLRVQQRSLEDGCGHHSD